MWFKLTTLLWKMGHLDHLTHKSDWHLVSPYSITSESNVEVTRMREMIAN